MLKVDLVSGRWPFLPDWEYDLRQQAETERRRFLFEPSAAHTDDKMIITPYREDVRQIVVMNPKGGCGKTTLVTNLASQFALRGNPAALVDNDPIGYASRWLERRPGYAASIHGPDADFVSSRRRWLRKPKRAGQTGVVLVDTPAAVNRKQVEELTRNADCILVPVIPSAFDIDSATRFVAELLLITHFDKPVGVIANRTRARTKSLRTLLRTLASFETPTVAALRNSQNYVTAAEAGLGLCELPHHIGKEDMRHMNQLMMWLDNVLFAATDQSFVPDKGSFATAGLPRLRNQAAAN